MKKCEHYVGFWLRGCHEEKRLSPISMYDMNYIMGGAGEGRRFNYCPLCGVKLKWKSKTCDCGCKTKGWFVEEK